VRIGADAVGTELNPVAVLLGKVALEYIPKFGRRLAEEVRRWGRWIQNEAVRELAEFYPKDKDGATPIAYLWARTVLCEGPGCGAEIPLIRSFWLTKKSSRTAGFRLVPNQKHKRIDFQIIDDPSPSQIGEPTVKRGAATCPLCGYTTPVTSVRQQLRKQRGGIHTARLFCVATIREGREGRFYRLPTEDDIKAVRKAKSAFDVLRNRSENGISSIPHEPMPPQGALGFRVQLYGMEDWGSILCPRQAVALATFAALIRKSGERLNGEVGIDLGTAVQTVLALNFTKLVEICTSLSRWEPNIPTVQNLFSRQAIAMCWDFAEGLPIGDGRGLWSNYLEKTADILETQVGQWREGHADQQDAAQLTLPDDSAQLFFTDPPYYDAVPYSDLSDLFYVWLRRALRGRHEDLFRTELTPKIEECIMDEVKGKDAAYFERTMREAMQHGRRVLEASGIGVLVFAHKSTVGWEAQLQAMIDAGWVITGSWPIDTENTSRMRAQSSAALASSIHIVCRPRENPGGSLATDEIGDWRDVLQELPRRIREWMPRLAKEGIVGADAIFACLGPALEVFSRYSQVEKPNGDAVGLKEYLEHVWGAVSKEALSMIFEGAATEGFEPDSRLTAMWLWTLAAPTVRETDIEENSEDESEEAASKKSTANAGFSLEYDAARKIAQGLGAHLEDLDHVVQVKGDTARLLSVAERTPHLFGKENGPVPSARKKKQKNNQLDLFKQLTGDESEENWEEKTVSKVGETTLDRVHQSMLLFAANRGEALRRLLIENGAGRDQRFWRLAQALSALYPKNCDEKRWVDGVLARKKGLGL
jgi:adenine-specific DNA methylase